MIGVSDLEIHIVPFITSIMPVCQLITEKIIYREFDNKLWRDQCFCFWLFCAVALYFIIQNFLKQKQNVTCLTLSTVDNSAAAPERLFNAPSHSGEEISCWYFHKISVLKPNHERGEKPVWFADLYSIAISFTKTSQYCNKTFYFHPIQQVLYTLISVAFGYFS